jgi:hypothetical protein
MNNIYSKAERYAAFLLSSLPNAQTVSIHSAVGPVCRNRNEVLTKTLDCINPYGVGLEFGVFNGDSLRTCGMHHPSKKFVGFDSFSGFPEDGRLDWMQDFSVKNLPTVPNNCYLVKGWFSDSVPKWLAENPVPIDFINIDCDLYSSTADVFFALENAKQIRSGLIIYFDEILNYNGYLINESLALFEMLERTGLGIQWIATHQKIRLLDESLSMLLAGTHPTWEQDLKTRYRQQASMILINDRNIYGPLHLNHYSKKVKAFGRSIETLYPSFFIKN